MDNFVQGLYRSSQIPAICAQQILTTGSLFMELPLDKGRGFLRHTEDDQAGTQNNEHCCGKKKKRCHNNPDAKEHHGDNSPGNRDTAPYEH